MKKAISILLYLWQLPQNLLGLILAAIYWPESSHGFRGERVFIASRMKGGITEQVSDLLCLLSCDHCRDEKND